MTVSFSTDGGQTWLPVVSSLAVGEMKRYGYKINRNGNIRLKFESENTGNKRVNLDNVQMSDWEDPDGIEIVRNTQNKNQNGVYDLSGRKVVNSKASGPIIIKQGKKSLRPSPAIKASPQPSPVGEGESKWLNY